MEFWSEWKEHDGGACPIPLGTTHEVRVRDGGYEVGICGEVDFSDDCYVWRSDGDASDITHYRIRVPLESLIGRRVKVEWSDGTRAERTLRDELAYALLRMPEHIRSISALEPDCSRQAPEAATLGTNPPACPPDREHLQPGVMLSDEPGIAISEQSQRLADDLARFMKSWAVEEYAEREAPSFPVTGFDHRLGMWK